MDANVSASPCGSALTKYPPVVGDTGVFFKIASKTAVCSRPMTLVFENGSGFGAVMDGRTVKVAQLDAVQAPEYAGGTLCIPTD